MVVQIKNPQWRFSVILAVVVLIVAYYGITDSDITSWGIFFSTLNAAVLTVRAVLAVGSLQCGKVVKVQPYFIVDITPLQGLSVPDSELLIKLAEI